MAHKLTYDELKKRVKESEKKSVEYLQGTEALKQTLEYYRTLVNEVSDGIFETNNEGTLVFANKTLIEMHGYENPEELVGKNFLEFVSQENRDRIAGRFRKAVQNGEFHGDIVDVYSIRKDGRTISVQLKAIPVIEEGRIVGTRGIIRDATELKRAEEKFKRQAAILQGINNVFREALTCERDEDVASTCLSVAEELTDSKFGFIGEVNQTGRFDTIALSNPGWDECKVPAKALVMIRNMVIRGIWGQVLKDEQSLIVNDPDSYSYRMGTPKGHPTINSFIGVPLKIADKCIGMVALANKESGYDLADQEAIEALSVAFIEALHRKRAEVALRESEEKYRSLVESTSDSIYVVDKDCNYIFMNQKHLSKFKLPGGEVIGRPYGEFHSEGETKTFSEEINKVFKVGNSISYEHKSERNGGYFIRTISPVKNSRGEAISAIVVSKDITEFKQAEEALIKETNQRKMLSKRLIDLLEKDRHQTAMELHDHIGQTLTSLKISLELAYGKLTPGHTELKDQITTAKERTVQALKDIKKISLGLRPSTLETLGLVPSLRELFNEIQKQTEIEIDFFSRRIPKQIEKEKELAIYRIAQEALTNIVKHAQSQKAFVNLTRKDSKLLLSLEDDGIGFDQQDEMKAPKKTGPMGLIIMRERAIQLGGEFSIESQKDKGTHVLAEIPL